MFFVFAYIVLSIPFMLFYPTKIIHKERLPKTKKYIGTSNHYSNLDSILYAFNFRRKFRFMAKKELFKNKLFGAVLKGLGGYPVDREHPSPSVYKKTLGYLKDNKTVFIFPEGTRNKDDSTGEMLGVKSGIITFASRGEADIVPMVLYRKSKLFRKNYIIVGEPFKIQGVNPKKLTKEETEENVKRYEQTMKNLRFELETILNSKNKKIAKKEAKKLENKSK